jgi:hypothetical protein
MNHSRHPRDGWCTEKHRAPDRDLAATGTVGGAIAALIMWRLLPEFAFTLIPGFFVLLLIFRGRVMREGLPPNVSMEEFLAARRRLKAPKS